MEEIKDNNKDSATMSNVNVGESHMGGRKNSHTLYQNINDELEMLQT